MQQAERQQQSENVMDEDILTYRVVDDLQSAGINVSRCYNTLLSCSTLQCVTGFLLLKLISIN